MSLAYITAASDIANASSYTFDTTEIASLLTTGGPVAVAIGSRGNTGQLITAVTIGGVAATQFVRAETSTTGNGHSAAVYAADVPASSSGGIAITYATQQLRAAVAVFSASGMDITAPHDTATSSLDAVDVSVDVPAGGAVIAVATRAPNGTAGWTGATERYSELIESFFVISVASESDLLVGSPRSVLCEWSDGSTLVNAIAAAVSLAPLAGPTTTTRRRFASQILS